MTDPFDPRQATHARRRAFALTALLALLGGCSDTLPVESFAGSGPAFDPVTFWTGHARSWGVLENRSGAPTDIVTTDCVGTAEGANGLYMIQHLTVGTGPAQTRDWHMRRLGDGNFEATANDIAGTARGRADGRAFHWSWVLETKPGNGLYDVTMDQWMYLMDDGGLVNRTTIRKLGVILAEVTEQFSRDPEAAAAGKK